MYWNVQYSMYCTPCLTSYHLSSPKIFHYGNSSHSCKPLPFYACFQLGFPLLSKKNYIEEDEQDGMDHCSEFRGAKTFEISFRVIPRKRKNTGILLRIIPRLEFFQKRQTYKKNFTLFSYSVKMYTFVSFFVSFCFVIQNRLFEATQNSACLVKQKNLQNSVPSHSAEQKGYQKFVTNHSEA
jgi:hypothetical protein